MLAAEKTTRKEGIIKVKLRNDGGVDLVAKELEEASDQTSRPTIDAQESEKTLTLVVRGGSRYGGADERVSLGAIREAGE